jgi:hypothetical protein
VSGCSFCHTLTHQRITNMCTIDPQTRTFIPCGPIVEVRQCAMRQWDIGGEQCENDAVEGSEFCTEHVGVKLCKATGIKYQHGGNRWFVWLDEIYPHPVYALKDFATKRRQFCSDRCRNLFRDTKQSRERNEAIVKMKSGRSHPDYELVKLEGASRPVLLNKKTSRYEWNVSLD